MEEIPVEEATIEIEVPKDIAVLAEKMPWIKRVLAEEGVKGVRRRLEKQAALDILTPEAKVSEEEIMEMDHVLKRAIARRLSDELPQDNS
jgi:hypothetical protein